MSERVRAEICNSAPPERYLNPDRLEPPPWGGFGLYLLDRLSDKWGVDGRCVWFELDGTGG